MTECIVDGFETYIITELGLSQETLSAYTRDVAEFLDFIGIQELTAHLVEKFISHLQKQNLKPTTIRRKCMSVRCLYRHLISKNHLQPNILGMIDSVRISKEKPNALEPKAMDALVATVESRIPVCRTTNVRRDIAIVRLLYDSGLRVSELVSLNLDDMKISRREILVKGKGCRDRMVPTTKKCIDAIQEYLDLDRFSDTNAVFVKSNGERITRRSVSDMLASVSRKAGVKHTTAHTLRSSCATSLMHNGMDLELIQRFLGHQNLSTTESYLSIDDSRLRDVHARFHPFGDKYAKM